MNSTQFTSQAFFALAARALLALVFLVMGCRHGVHRSRVAADLTAHGMPHGRVFIVAAILIELAGGSSLLLGFGARWAAAALALFTILATLVYYRSVSDPEHLVHLLKNLAIVGGLLMVACCGPGPLCLGGDCD